MDVSERMGGRSLPVLALVAAVVVVGVVLMAGATLLRGGGRIDRQPTIRATIDDTTVVMFGDSITEFGDWRALLPAHRTANQGYAGSTTAQLLPRAEEVAREMPRVVMVLAGTNDIRDEQPPDWSVANLRSIVLAIRNGSPETTIVLQTVLPRSDEPDEVLALNDGIVELAAELDVEVLDTHAALDDGSGRPCDGCSTDGIHLTDEGYRRWAEVLNDRLAAR